MTAQRTAWNRASDAYNSLHEDDLSLIGLATGEVWALLGAVAGLDVLEIGCGAGQNCVELARRGARVTGVDVSDAQLALARQRVAEAGVPVRLLRADAADLSPLAPGSFDAIVAVYVFPYVAEMADCLAECVRLLRPGGRLIFAQDHPIRASFWDEEMQEESVLPARSYFDDSPLGWTFAGTDAAMTSYHRTLGWWFSSLHEAGFTVSDLRELPLPEGWEEGPDVDEYTRDIASFLPQVMVIEAAKR
ncbi:MAG: methyltransferase domain-containing protein [Caldilineaceae bacterium]|nr:methyltransferase domain-containing protein [Caldilineaceae bacterium]